MKYFSKIFTLMLIANFQLDATDAIITFFIQKYPYFKIEHSKKFDPEKYSKQLKQPSFFYQTISNMQKYNSALPGVMCLYGGNVALSDRNGQVIFKRNQQTPNLYFLVTKSVLPAYIYAPSTVHHWMLDSKEPSELYFAEFKQNNQLELYYYEVSKSKLPEDFNIPLNTIVFIADPKEVFISHRCVSPSAMMDGQVSAIRNALDDEGFTDVSIMSHSAKHRSNFYAPFRDAAECAPKFGDRKTYQVPYTNAREAMMEVETDIDEGVDIVMIKPALSYLDLIAETRRRFNIPVAAYSVSGEYALVKGAAQLGYVNEKDITKEILYSIKRAGADMIVTYFAKSASRFLQES